MAKYGVWMLERLVLKYSELGGSSRGMRAFVQEAVPQLKASNPQLDVQIKSTSKTAEFGVQGGPIHPCLVAYYRNGRKRELCVKNMQPDAIAEQVYWLRNSHGRGQEDRVVTSRHLSRQPSIQGPWTGKTFASDLRGLNAQRLAAASGNRSGSGSTWAPATQT